jgi:hypothetical protein
MVRWLARVAARVTVIVMFGRSPGRTTVYRRKIGVGAPQLPSIDDKRGG